MLPLCFPILSSAILLPSLFHFLFFAFLFNPFSLLSYLFLFTLEAFSCNSLVCCGMADLCPPRAVLSSDFPSRSCSIAGSCVFPQLLPLELTPARRCSGDSSLRSSRLTAHAWATALRLSEGPALKFENSLGGQKGPWAYLHFRDLLIRNVGQTRWGSKCPPIRPSFGPHHLIPMEAAKKALIPYLC